MRMNHASTLLALLLAGLLALPACSSAGGSVDPADAPAQEQEAEAADSLPDDPLEGITADSRVVAVSRSVVELWQLAGGECAGVTDDARDLQGIAEEATSVGSADDPDVSQIAALEPDLVLVPAELSSCQRLCDDLAASSIPTFVVDVNSFDEYDDAMVRLTTATGRTDLYQQNVTQVRSQVEQVIENTTSTAGDSYVTLAASAAGTEVLASDSFVCVMLDELGMANAAASEQDTPISLDDVVETNPTWIFVTFVGGEGEAQQAFSAKFTSQGAWKELTAATAGHVVMLPRQLFQNKPNARWGEAYAYLSQVLHGAWA